MISYLRKVPMLRNLLNYLLNRHPYARLQSGEWKPVVTRDDTGPGYLLGPFSSEEACQTFCRLANQEPMRVHYPCSDEESLSV